MHRRTEATVIMEFDQPISSDESPASEPVRTRAQRLRHAMELRGVRSNELDRIANLGGGWTSRFLSEKKTNPGTDSLQRVCDALHIRLDWLMKGTGPMDAELEPTTSASRILTPIASASRWHPDVEATVRLWRNRKRWSDAALALADEIARSRHVEPDRWPAILDDFETHLSRIRETFRP